MSLVTFVIAFLIIANTAAGVLKVDGLILDNVSDAERQPS